MCCCFVLFLFWVFVCFLCVLLLFVWLVFFGVFCSKAQWVGRCKTTAFLNISCHKAPNACVMVMWSHTHDKLHLIQQKRKPTAVNSYASLSDKKQTFCLYAPVYRYDITYHGPTYPSCGPLNYFLFQPVLRDWCNKGRGMCYPVYGMMYIK